MLHPLNSASFGAALRFRTMRLPLLSSLPDMKIGRSEIACGQKGFPIRYVKRAFTQGD
jgi:hypothetical protein